MSIDRSNTATHNGKQEQRLCEEQISLLDEQGYLTYPSYCFVNKYDYNRDAVAQKRRLKEWEFYQISNGEYCIQLTYGHVSYTANVGCTVINFADNSRVSCQAFLPIATKKFALPFATDNPHSLQYISKGIALNITNDNSRHLTFSGKGIELDITLSNSGEALYYCTQYDKKLFYYNSKRVFDSLCGSLTVCGKEYDLARAYAVLDSGRGCWPYKHEWYWGMGRGYDGNTRIDFNIGRNFSERSSTNENALFINGVGYKLGVVSFALNTQDYLAPWTVTSQDGAFVGTFTPVYDNYTETNLLLIHNRCHQVFGTLEATVKVGDIQYALRDAPCFIERAVNRW